MIDLIKIRKDENYSGYFFHIANSRSGHNFIRNNIQSWIDGYDKKYINLESQPLSEIRPLISFFSESESLRILNLRSLLNWYSSIFYFFYGKKNTSPKKDWIFVTKSDINRNRELIRNPNVAILNDGQTKEELLKIISPSPISREFLESMLNHQIDSWLWIAKEFTGATNLLPDFVKIYYDEFFLSQKYRKEICRKINGSYNEDVLNRVTDAGGYSTFDGNKYVLKGNEMKTTERWKQWKPMHEYYRKFIMKHEAFDFYINNFDIPADEKAYIEKLL